MKSFPIQAVIGKNFVWVHNPKTAGTTFTEACLNYGVGKKLFLPMEGRPKRSIGDHLTFREIETLYPGKLPQLSIGFVRNPVDRLQSLWNFCCKNQAVQRRNMDTFTNILLSLPSQREYLDGVFSVLRLEELHMPTFLYQMAALEDVKLPVGIPNKFKNASNPSIDPLTPNEITHLEPYWKPDAEFFKYEC